MRACRSARWTRSQPSSVSGGAGPSTSGSTQAAAVFYAIYTLFKKLPDVNEIEGELLSPDDAPQLWQRIAAVQQQLSSHRSEAFLGSMLKYHHHRSTKFMAQWIEAKNKLAAQESQECSNVK